MKNKNTGFKDSFGKEIHEGENVLSMELIGLGEGFVSVVFHDESWCIFSGMQGYLPLKEAAIRKDIILTVINK